MQPVSAGRPRPARLRLALALAVMAALAGCSWFSSADSKGSKRASASCPTAIVLNPLKQTAVFVPGAERQPLNVAFYGILDDIQIDCSRRGDAVQATLDVTVIGERGPSARGGTGVDLQYFIAVTGPDQTILAKRSLPVHIAIPLGEKRAGITDHIEETIPLGGRAPGDLSVVAGFQQSPEVVDFYRHYRGR